MHLQWQVSDQVWMLENSIYSILSPEGFCKHFMEGQYESCAGCKSYASDAADLKEMGIEEKVFGRTRTLQ